MAYAEDTRVAVSKTKADIEAMVVKRGGNQFMTGWTEEMAHVAFRVDGRLLRFYLPLPENFTPKRERQLWRALMLVIKAKFESVESGIETFDDAFLSNITMPDGSTVGEWARPQVALMYDRGEMPPLLEGPKS